ncbi:MAG TPA: alpha/beta hydrolase [Candidatus Kryptonia bacterium]|nr:alpha/beta hydrolase [Candidatus Kryptonia bacterium]
MSWLFLLVSLVGAWLTYNAYRPIYAPPRRAAISFFAGWLTTELALHHIAWQVIATLLFARLGALHAWPGKLGLVISLASWVGLWRCYWRARETEEVVEQALRAGLGDGYRSEIRPEISAQFAPAVDWKQIVLPFPMRHAEVQRIRDIQYTRAAGLNLKLDVYRHRSHPTGCPTLLQIHGGGWVIGSKNEQGIPLMLQMASRGWVCVSADYRLSPHATFPDHLVDIKRAVQWIREHGAEYGADPEFVIVTGGSAGGHLAALAALTANDPEYQRGFEQVDTALQGCVPFYGVYDFTDRHGVLHHDALAELLEQRVMKASRSEAPEAYQKASPMSRVHTEAPPFFVIHGDLDTLVPVAEARHFAEILRGTLRAPVAYAEIPGAQHAFELFPSLRTAFVVHGVERFLAYLYSRHLAARSAERTAAVAAAG